MLEELLNLEYSYSPNIDRQQIWIDVLDSDDVESILFIGDVYLDVHKVKQ
jgi:predicted RNA-binding protein associated with RNAse of E/G family